MKVCVVKTQTSWPVTILWAVLSVAVASITSFSFLQPAWFIRREYIDAAGYVTVLQFGTFGFCYRHGVSPDAIDCLLYEDDRYHAPSAIWPVVCVLGGSACLILNICAVLSFLVFTLPTAEWRKRVTVLTGHVQGAAVLSLLIGVVIFPAGLGSGFAQHHCGIDSVPYWGASCELGWALMLTLVTSLIGLYCPILARFTVTAAVQPDTLSNLNYM